MTTNIFDQQKLEALLAEGKIAEAKEYASSCLTAPSAMGTKTGAAIDYAHIYMKAMNRINERYLRSLRQAEELLTKIASVRSKADDAMEIARLKAGLR